MQRKVIHRTALTVLGITVLSIAGFGQASESSRPTNVRVAGRVTDVTKAGVPNTVVVLKVPGVNESVSKVRSDQDGYFQFPSIRAQAYDIWFESPGFSMLKFEAKKAAEGGDYDIGVVELTLPFWGDTVDISPPPSTPASPIHTTLCELVKDGDHFHGNFVELRAAVYPSPAGATPRLVDTSCGASVELSFPDEQPTSPGRDLPVLRRYVEQHQVTIATVSGKFSLVPVYHGDLRYTLKLFAARDPIITSGTVPGPSPNRR